MSAGSAAARRWVEPAVVLAVHDRQLAEHGGADGIRDRGAIESALAQGAVVVTGNVSAFAPTGAEVENPFSG